MADMIYQTTGDLPVGDDTYAHILTDNGSSLFLVNVLSGDKKAIKANLTQQIHLGAGFMIRGKDVAVEFAGENSGFFNEGSVSSANGTALAFGGGGTSSVTNIGTLSGASAVAITSNAADARLHLVNTGGIYTTAVAVTGGKGADRIYNTGIMSTIGATLMDLGDGNDFYDGSQGIAIGTIVLGAGNDTAIGGGGADVFAGGAGDDYLDGGAGIDTADYSSATTHLTVNLQTTTRQLTNQGWDTLLNIENVTGGTGNDSFTGNSGDNVLSGGAGNDTLEGGAGNDVLDGGAGDNDWAQYSGTSAAYVSLANPNPQNTIGYGWDTLIGIEHLAGGSGADELKGNELANKLTGNNGNDTLDGAGGNDTLDGGNGNDSLRGGIGMDSLIGGANNDTFEGGDGNDTLEGGDGNDMAIFAGAKSDYTISVTTGDENTQYTVKHTIEGGQGGEDSLKGIRLLKFLNDADESDDDEIYGLTNAAPTGVSLSGSGVKENSAVDAFVGTLSGTDPDGDALTFTLINDAGGLFKLDTDGRTIRVAKTAGLDYDLKSSFTIRVRVSDGIKNLSDGALSGTVEKDVVVKLINEYEYANVVRYGTSASEQVVGEYGNDRVYGLSGNDQVFGQLGNDTLYGGAGNDTLIGGAGRDAFVLDVKPNVRSNLDRIYDFNPKDDTIHLSRKIFSKISKGTLKKSAFVVGDHFKDKDDRILYHKKGGGLFYDPDGSGSAKAVQIATIGNNLKITASDFLIF